jgi:hypothetical protein
LSPQKPIRVAYEKNPDKIAEWLEQRYPAIAARAKQEKAILLWLDQTGLRSDAAVSATWAPVGQTPVVPKTGTRFTVNAMCALSNKGELYFTVFEGGFNVQVMIPFLDRLVRHLDRKIHLIVDGHPSHRAHLVRDWLAERADRIEMHFLPGYAPELNPVDCSTPTSNTTSPQGQVPATEPSWPTAPAPTSVVDRTSPTASKPCSARTKSATPRTRHATFALRINNIASDVLAAALRQTVGSSPFVEEPQPADR